jgi:hypothetical protein
MGEKNYNSSELAISFEIKRLLLAHISRLRPRLIGFWVIRFLKHEKSYINQINKFHSLTGALG